MKTTALIVLLIFSVSNLLLAGALRPQRLVDMIDRVEVMAIVKIQSVDPPQIDFEVIEIIAGEMAKGNHKTDYALPPFNFDGKSFHISIPGSGIETALEAGEKYIFLFERKGTLVMIRAEMISEMETVKETWKKHQTKKTIDSTAHPGTPPAEQDSR